MESSTRVFDRFGAYVSARNEAPSLIPVLKYHDVVQASTGELELIQLSGLPRRCGLSAGRNLSRFDRIYIR